MCDLMVLIMLVFWAQAEVKKQKSVLAGLGMQSQNVFKVMCQG